MGWALYMNYVVKSGWSRKQASSSSGNNNVDVVSVTRTPAYTLLHLYRSKWCGRGGTDGRDQGQVFFTVARYLFTLFPTPAPCSFT